MLRKIVRLEDLDYRLYLNILSLYRSNPLIHIYLFYDIIYDIDYSRFYFVVDHKRHVLAYLLLWNKYGSMSTHLWYNDLEAADLLINYIPCIKGITIVYGNEIVERVINKLSMCGYKLKVKNYLTMSVSNKEFKPYYPERAIRLTNKHLEQFTEFKKKQGVTYTLETARKILGERIYYGVFINNELVSTACSYLRTRDIWVIGDVYTLPKYRNRGYGKITTSAITATALNSGARALLHVYKKNKPAVNLYKRLGYRTLYTTKWIYTS